MALGKYRTRFASKGLGNLEVREVSPSAGTEFLNAGWLGEQGTEIGEVYEQELHRDETGSVANVDNHSRLTTLSTNLKQIGIDEMNLIRNAVGKVHALRYSGMVNPSLFQYYCIEQGKINPSMARGFKPGKNPLPFRAVALRQDDASFVIPELYVAETNGRIRTENLQLWVSPRHGYTSETAKVLDISGWARHGTLNSDFAAIWQQTTNPAEFLRFDGVNDECDFGDILDDDGVSDFLIEVWLRVQAADGTSLPVLCKKNAFNGSAAGFSIFRFSNNAVFFQLDSGAASVNLSVNSATQNLWKHFAIAIDRNGLGTPYMNGVPGSASSVAAIGNAQNALSLFFGRDGSGARGQVDKGDVRFYKFGAGGLPSDIAAIISRHFEAERAYYGV